MNINLFKSNSRVVNYAIALVLLHLPVLLIHGAAHGGESVIPSLVDTVFIVSVIWTAPLVSVVLLKRQRWQLGSMLFLAAMLGSLVFGVSNHFMMPGPDNVASVPAGFWQAFFQISALLLAIMEAIGTLLGVQLVWFSLRRTSLVA